ncbi:MAG: hypothetical protein FJY07_04255, partial [Bacteroidetes bacterium]|nr:hypothetical protein [Bacteroidota bacterium]
MKRGLVFLSFFLYFYAFAQDTVIELQAVQVSASRLNTFTAGLKILAFDSLALQKRQFNSLSELISEETPVFIKTYGQGSLATISFRGTAATHTGIYWNGIPLNPVTSGLFDLSLAPAGFFNSIRVLEGGSGSLFGSGNIGGSIHLNNEPVFGNGQTIQAGISAGSFQEYGGIFKTLTSARRIFSSTALMVKTAENDFRFQNLYNEKVTQQNAAFRQYGLIQDFYWKPTVNWMLGAAIWLQSGFREIPSTMVTGSSEADQQDKSIRTVISARKFFTLGSASLKLAYLHDSLHYRNPASLLDSDKDSRISSDRLLAEAQADRRLWKNMIISAGACLTGEYAVSNNFDGRVSQNRLGLYLSVLEVIPALKWKLNLNLRQDLTEGY